MSTLEGENFHSVVHLKKRIRPDQRDDFESVISRNPVAFCQQKLVFPMHPNLRGWEKKYKWYRQIVAIWMLFLEVMKLMYFWHRCRHSHMDVVGVLPWDFLLPWRLLRFLSLAPSTYLMPDLILSNAGSICLYRRTVRCFLSSDSRPPIARIGWLQQCRVNSYRKWRFCYS